MKHYDVSERIVEQDGTLFIQRSQDVQSMIDDNHALSTVAPKSYGPANFRLVGRVPLVIIEEWSRICGAAIGTKEFTEFVRKQLLNGDFSKFLVKGF